MQVGVLVKHSEISLMCWKKLGIIPSVGVLVSATSGTLNALEVGLLTGEIGVLLLILSPLILLLSVLILLLKGLLRVDFYTSVKKYLFSKIIKSKDIIMLVHKGHGFKVLRNVEMLEIKQGPYILTKDKIKFKNIDENKIKIKK